MCLLPSIWRRNYGEAEGHQIASSSFSTKQHIHLSNVERMTKLGWRTPMKGLLSGKSWVFSRKRAWKKLRAVPISSQHCAMHFTCIMSLLPKALVNWISRSLLYRWRNGSSKSYLVACFWSQSHEWLGQVLKPRLPAYITHILMSTLVLVIRSTCPGPAVGGNSIQTPEYSNDPS